MERSELSTGTMTTLAAVSARTLRHYHQIGLLPEPKRTAGGYRRYTVSDLIRLLQIRRIAAMGLSLDQVSQVLHDPSSATTTAILDDLDHDLAQRIAIAQEQRSVIAKLRSTRAPIEAVPEFAADLADLLASAPCLDTAHEAALAELVAALGSPSDVTVLHEALGLVVSHPTADEAAALETRLMDIGPHTNDNEIEQLAEDIIELTRKLRTTDEATVNGGTVSPALRDLLLQWASEQLSTKQQQVLVRALERDSTEEEGSIRGRSAEDAP